MSALLLALFMATTPEVSTTDDGGSTVGRRWALGLQVGAYDLPSGHLGIPVAGTADGTHLATAIVGRYQLSHFTAIDVGMGLPTSASAPAFWGEFEIFGRLWADPRQVVAFELYGAPGLQLGFAGPDYYARRSNTWVGYDYAFGGAATFALRLPLGIRVCWAQNLFDTYLEAAEIVAFTPSVESLFELSVGARIHW
jgi:hypothetical protein